jgi:hypothetical protein
LQIVKLKNAKTGEGGLEDQYTLNLIPEREY